MSVRLEVGMGQRVRAWRRHRGLTQQQLLERVTGWGLSMSRPTLLRLERGERPFTVEELLVISVALDVPPLLLLLPLGQEGEVDMAPMLRMAPETAVEWLLGQEPPVLEGRVVGSPFDFHRAAMPLTLWRELEGSLRRFRTLLAEVQAAENADDEAGRHRALARCSKAAPRVREAIVAYRAEGMEPPAWHPRALEVFAEALGIDVADVRRELGLRMKPPQGNAGAEETGR